MTYNSVWKCAVFQKVIKVILYPFLSVTTKTKRKFTVLFKLYNLCIHILNSFFFICLYMYIIPFACNPKSFAIAILVFLFLLFFFLVAVFGQIAKSFLPMFHHFLPRVRVNKIGLILFGHTKRSLHKNCSLSCYQRRGWPMTNHGLIHGNQHSQHSTKHKKHPETRKQVR